VVSHETFSGPGARKQICRFLATQRKALLLRISIQKNQKGLKIMVDNESAADLYSRTARSNISTNSKNVLDTLDEAFLVRISRTHKFQREQRRSAAFSASRCSTFCFNDETTACNWVGVESAIAQSRMFQGK
jgi:hypothetical protein